MTTISPKKDGGPNIDFFQSSESLAQFDQIRVWLQKNCKKHVQTDPPTKEGLAQLVVQLIQYQENKLGKNSADPPFLRLPWNGGQTVAHKPHATLLRNNCDSSVSLKNV
ncbi:hypothetical protein EVAR_55738_1 [Eumeta japonica]|uniref:Chromo domain-containing protein n=1 Tax=Eumeta variegata TaxID=151549 RepID=A0A4C1XBA2_EUMVA|nr:hypothetical protein EVAR_55738_1 [Eumeta japonica]